MRISCACVCVCVLKTRDRRRTRSKICDFVINISRALVTKNMYYILSQNMIISQPIRYIEFSEQLYPNRYE